MPDVCDKQNDTNIVLSIIIPVYNAEKYLEECLNSILSQDINRGYEIICVDDGSTDSSSEILTKYAEQYSCIKVVKKDNGGVSSARNLGIKKANGKWIWFIDADDYIVFDCCNFLLDQAEKAETDLVVFAGKTVYEYKEKRFESDKVNISFANGRKDVMDLSPKKSYANGPYFYLFKSDRIVNSRLLFDLTMKYAEDTKFIFEYKFSCEKAVLVDAEIYCYRQNPQSAMHTLNSQAHAECMWKLAELYDKYTSLCAEEETELKKRFEIAKCRSVRNMLFDYCINIRDYSQAKAALNKSKEKGWYPYKVKMGIYSKSFKGILINLFNECLEVRWIYLLVSKLLSRR